MDIKVGDIVRVRGEAIYNYDIVGRILSPSVDYPTHYFIELIKDNLNNNHSTLQVGKQYYFGIDRFVYEKLDKEMVEILYG